jgi:hypothetical protein
MGTAACVTPEAIHRGDGFSLFSDQTFDFGQLSHAALLIAGVSHFSGFCHELAWLVGALTGSCPGYLLLMRRDRFRLGAG